MKYRRLITVIAFLAGTNLVFTKTCSLLKNKIECQCYLILAGQVDCSK